MSQAIDLTYLSKDNREKVNFTSRAYNIFQKNTYSDSSVIKTSKESRLKDEIEFYLDVPLALQSYFPRVLNHVINDETSFYSLEQEYYAYNNLGNIMINEEFSQERWSKVFNFILKYFSNCQSYKDKKDNSSDCYQMYIEKTENEYNNLVTKFPFFKELNQAYVMGLNGEELYNFQEVWPQIKEFINRHYLTSDLTFIHGDFCFSNILFGEHPITKDVILKFIDPRGSFGQSKSSGDIYYDLAKLKHSCEGGYEYFITDNFLLSQNSSVSFQLEFSNSNKIQIETEFNTLIEKHNYDMLKVDILQGCIFIGMCARHYDSLERQKAMYLTGLKILNRCYKQIIQKEK